AGNVSRTCDDAGEWVDVACSFICSDGACAGECKPGAAHCDGLQPVTCNDQGEWVTGDACPHFCLNGECVGECTPGATACSDNDDTLLCNDQGEWGVAESCGGEGFCSDGACQVCLPGETRCVGTATQACDA